MTDKVEGWSFVLGSNSDTDKNNLRQTQQQVEDEILAQKQHEAKKLTSRLSAKELLVDNQQWIIAYSTNGYPIRQNFFKLMLFQKVNY